MAAAPVWHFLWHFTHIDNLPSILASGALVSKNHASVEHDLSNPDIQTKRRRIILPEPPENCSLHDCVPFYFAPRSPMMYRHRGIQKQLLYLVTTPEAIAEAGLHYWFTDRHPINALANTYRDHREIGQRIDTSLMESTYWNDTPDDPDRKLRRMAEFLVYGRVPLELIGWVLTYDQPAQQAVIAHIQRHPDCGLRAEQVTFTHGRNNHDRFWF